MLKACSIIIFIVYLSACKPITEVSTVKHLTERQETVKQEVQEINAMQCISSQSQCDVETELGHFAIKFSQQQLGDNIKAELPFTIELSELSTMTELPVSASEQATAAISKVSAHIEGRDMFMGKVAVLFAQNNSGIYSADSLLASCHAEFMVWRLWVTVEKAEAKQTFFVDFTSQS